METMFKYFDIQKAEDGSFAIASKDRGVTSEERWVVNPMSEEEAKQLYMYLQRYFMQREEEL